MDNLSVNGNGNQGHTYMSQHSNQYYPSMPHSNEDFFQEYTKVNPGMYKSSNSTVSSIPAQSLVVQQPQAQIQAQPQAQFQPQTQTSFDPEVITQLTNGMSRMMAILERLEQRISRVEQSTSQILKNQQESFQVPFMSQKEIDTARTLAEQLEQDTSVAKQLQAAYNKEVEVKKRTSVYPMMLAECPMCGARVAQNELEVHVEKCLDMFSNDPQKEIQVKETKQKMETGFFGKFFNKTKTETTTTTKVLSRSNSNAVMPEHSSEMAQQGLYPAYAYPQFAQNQHNMNINGVPMMMPMYMYPGYPGMPTQNE